MFCYARLFFSSREASGLDLFSALLNANLPHFDTFRPSDCLNVLNRFFSCASLVDWPEVFIDLIRSAQSKRSHMFDDPALALNLQATKSARPFVLLK